MSPEYVAGFFDGEGTFYIGKQIKNNVYYPHATVLLSQSGEDGKELLCEIQAKYGGKIYQHLKPGEHGATKPAFKLYWNKKEAIILIQKLLPFLKLKQVAAQAVLEYLTRHD